MDTKGIKLSPPFEKALLDLGFSEFTEIQEQCIPLIQQGKDVIGLSHTGSGKTAAFGFPALEKVQLGKGLQLLVLVPTRELCAQVTKEFRKFTTYHKLYITEVYGGVGINPQIHHLQKTDVMVGTPGRTLDHLQRGTLNLSKVHTLVLDEADKMFEMGFIEDIRKILSKVPRNSQRLLFSATMSSEVMSIAKNYMTNPEKVKMQVYIDKSKLLQHYYDIDRNEKFSLLLHLLKNELKGLTIVFCSTRHAVDIIAKNLYKNGIKSEAIHGGLSQNKRTHVMEEFKNGQLDVLVASDVAARGLDIKHVNLIINYDLPKSSQEYVHRIGRTARAGSEGKVISLLAREDYDNFSNVLQDREILIHKIEKHVFEKVPLIKPMRPQRPFGHGGGRPRFGGHSGHGSNRPRNFSRR